MKTLLIVFVVALKCQAVKFPHTFKLCKRSDPDFPKCLREAAEFNIHQLVHPFKDLRIPGLKPLLIPSLVIGSGKRAVAVEQRFHNCNFHGFEHVLLEKFEFDFKKNTLIIDSHIPEVTKKCDYKLSGRVLLLPIQGEGESTIVLKNVTIAGYFNYETVKRSGKTYLRFVDHHLSLDVSHVYYHFDNLFNGDKALGDNINKVLNDNWSEVFEDVKGGYSEVMNQIIQTLLNNFWSVVSLEDAFGEK
ncbi:Circadian clock-controlled protein-like Protein [Tribolium castaneum]|uniref:Circadian clock-controlled protein-like Protein n=3 Tax=Tribolium castaneum TaxID=7070 RepID=D2A489_TRICA|nr:Circadian clock-controlled protein-like Protein [Tribolium castaneum]